MFFFLFAENKRMIIKQSKANFCFLRTCRHIHISITYIKKLSVPGFLFIYYYSKISKMQIVNDSWTLKGTLSQIQSQFYKVSCSMSDYEDDQFRLNYLHTDAEGESVLRQIRTARLNKVKFTLFVIASVIFGGIPLLLIHWFPQLERIFHYDFVPYEECTHVVIINFDELITICRVEEGEVYLNEVDVKTCKTFVNRYLRYYIDDKRVAKAQLFDFQGRIRRITTAKDRGLTQRQVEELRKCYGKGAMEIEKPHWYVILIKEMLRPLYLFLFFSVALWFYELYNIYASIILGTSVFAIGISVYQILSLNIKIHSMAYYEVKMNALRDGVVTETSSIDLVPGDVVFLRDPIKIPFEGIIIEGSALINECALTGESVPVVKKADVLDHYTSSEKEIDKSAYVFEGTTIIQVNSKKKMAIFESYREEYGVPVCVTRTNFLTLKGQLIRIILYPKEQENVFQRESAKFLIVLFFIAIITYFGMIPKLSDAVSGLDLFIKFLDLITITVPPALPISMTAGIIYALEKLKKKEIFCIEESRVITGGVVSFCCFDKTGTLTEDFMDFEALIPADKGQFFERIRNRANNKFHIETAVKEKPFLAGILSNMASNHSIIKIEETDELVGDPMEIKLFEFGKFSLNQSIEDPEVIFGFQSTRKQAGVVYRRFEFDSDLQRMSVVCKSNEDGSFHAYAKGSPEMMATIMEKISIPQDYNQILKEYTSNGFRVLAIASKQLVDCDFKKVTREEAERGLSFNGFEVFENKLKPETKAAIGELKEAAIGTVMITGDNPLTGSNIGYKCGISHREKGMLIIDFKNQKFTDEKFIFNQRDEESDFTRISFETSGDKPEETFNLDKSNKVKLSPISFEMVTRQNFHAKNKVANEILEVQNDNAEEYMRKMIQHANETNSQLCVTGNAFNKLFEGKVEEISQIKRKFLDHATVFARTKPHDKAKIVMVYQHTGRTVSMCGDGANDCGALKQADIGLSLAQTEASMSAPFTSQITNISSMVELIKECRAGLATNFSLFNIMASYSLTQYTTSIVDQIFYSYPADFHYLYWDIACNFFFIVVFGFTGTADKLSVEIPNNSLFCFTNLFQILFYFGINVLGQISMIMALSGIFNSTISYQSIAGMENNKALYIAKDDWLLDSPEGNILFLFTNFLYLFTVLAFSIGGPWRKPFFTNIPFMVVFVFIITYTIVIVMVPAARLDGFQIMYIDDTALCGFILGVGLGLGVVIFVIQKFVWEPLAIWVREKYPEKKWL